MTNKLKLQVYHGVEASVNAYIFSDGQSTVLVDCLRNSAEARLLAQKIKEEGKLFTHILITHGHPDHYTGMNVLKQEFPDVKIVVNTQEIKNDIIGFSSWMESVGWLEKEPALKPKSESNPLGFDYQELIEVLERNELRLVEGSILELNSNYSSAECAHLTTIYSEDLNAFFANDFCYNVVHPWLAIEKQSIANWKNQLAEFSKTLAFVDPAVYPGHGQPGTIAMFDEMAKYITDFEEVVANATSRSEAMEKMQSLYPEYAQADFLLVYSVNEFVRG